eukprot:PhF_6_TR7299/c0_g1_i3/m.10915
MYTPSPPRKSLQQQQQQQPSPQPPNASSVVEYFRSLRRVTSIPTSLVDMEEDGGDSHTNTPCDMGISTSQAVLFGSAASESNLSNYSVPVCTYTPAPPPSGGSTRQPHPPSFEKTSSQSSMASSNNGNSVSFPLLSIRKSSSIQIVETKSQASVLLNSSEMSSASMSMTSPPSSTGGRRRKSEPQMQRQEKLLREMTVLNLEDKRDRLLREVLEKRMLLMQLTQSL